ncbi:hypothetical protein FH972_012035 [Carpinus fangiana]|uniref:Uncharacterized protein n=1 Tax=Carpinus fangiana TaxID=176857 RepID=A0A5N6R5P2_9ROSI|nr:hypothetical protein FH972_012035 [Carpinus fangiana]
MHRLAWPVFCLVFKWGWREGHRFPAKSDGGGSTRHHGRDPQHRGRKKQRIVAVWVGEVPRVRRGEYEERPITVMERWHVDE